MIVVIMAGGSGTRFWPASRADLPKQFLRIISDKTMLEETVARVENLADCIYVVTNEKHGERVKQLLDEQVEILTEPIGKNTAPCIGLSAMHILRKYGNVPMAVLPADHFVADPQRLKERLQTASEVAADGSIVTLGIIPTRPETGYGYIERGNLVSSEKKIYEVRRFVEKPSLDKAIEFVSEGKYFWNSGIFVFTAQTILSEIKKLMPDIYKELERIEEALELENYECVLKEAYEKMPSISIDYAVMEKTKQQIYVLESDFGWSDVGSWLALYELRKERDENQNLILADALLLESKANLVYSQSNRLVCLLGVEGLVIVDTSDVLLVADLEYSQEVKKFPELLKANGREGLY